MPLLHDERYCEPYDMDNQSELFHHSFLWLLLSKNDACQYWQRCYQLRGRYIYPTDSIISKSFVNSRDDKHISKNWFTAMCWLMSNNVTVTGFIFFFFFFFFESLVITAIITDTLAVLLHLIYQFFCSSGFISLFKMQVVLVLPQA